MTSLADEHMGPRIHHGLSQFGKQIFISESANTERTWIINPYGTPSEFCKVSKYA